MYCLLDMNGYTIINCPSIGGGGSLTSDTLNINSGSVNYLTKNLNTVNSI